MPSRQSDVSGLLREPLLAFRIGVRENMRGMMLRPLSAGEKSCIWEEFGHVASLWVQRLR